MDRVNPFGSRLICGGYAKTVSCPYPSVGARVRASFSSLACFARPFRGPCVRATSCGPVKPLSLAAVGGRDVALEQIAAAVLRTAFRFREAVVRDTNCRCCR